MSTPRTKRQFAGSSADPAQRQITSFFSPRTGSEEATTPEARQAQAQAQALLPASVQANLLSVGMRIRKSVPEGYKTCGPSAFRLWTDNTPLPLPLPLKAHASSAVRASSRELQPFCGINKIGGLDPQPAFASDLEDQVPELDAVPELTLSQESVDGNGTEPSRKRVYVENDVDEEPAIPLRLTEGWDEGVSPRSFAPSEWRSARVMAVPRTRAKKTVSFEDISQENMTLDRDGDFEEADFLVLGQAREMDMS